MCDPRDDRRMHRIACKKTVKSYRKPHIANTHDTYGNRAYRYLGTAVIVRPRPPWAPWAPWRRANEASVTYLLTSKCHFELVSVRAPGHPARSRGPVPRHCRGTAAAIPTPEWPTWPCPNTKDGPRPRSNRPTCHTCHSSRAHHGALSGGSAALQRCSSGLKVLAHATTLDDATHQARL